MVPGCGQFRSPVAAQRRACRSDLTFTYEIGPRLGEGASAEVFRATNIQTGANVAIKVFSDNKSETIHAACAEFVCAMRSAGASALAYHELAFLRGKPALVMELGERCLDSWIRVGAPAPAHTARDQGLAGCVCG